MNNPFFAEISIGTRFRWLSNLGAGDLLEKTGAETYRNLTTKGQSRPLTDSIFTPADRVKVEYDFAQLCAAEILCERDPAAASQMGFEEERDALADAIRQKFGRLVEIARELLKHRVPLPFQAADRLSVELCRCNASAARD